MSNRLDDLPLRTLRKIHRDTVTLAGAQSESAAIIARAVERKKQAATHSTRLLQPMPEQLMEAISLAVGGALLQANAKCEVFAHAHAFLRGQTLATLEQSFQAGNNLLVLAGGGVCFDKLVSAEFRDAQLAAIAGQAPPDAHLMTFDLLGIRDFIINQMVDRARQRCTAGGQN